MHGPKPSGLATKIHPQVLKGSSSERERGQLRAREKHCAVPVAKSCVCGMQRTRPDYFVKEPPRGVRVFVFVAKGKAHPKDCDDMLSTLLMALKSGRNS